MCPLIMFFTKNLKMLMVPDIVWQAYQEVNNNEAIVSIVKSEPAGINRQAFLFPFVLPAFLVSKTGQHGLLIFLIPSINFRLILKNIPVVFNC